MIADYKHYFEDENEGKKLCKRYQYYDENGVLKWGCREVDMPYRQKYEILPPVFIAMDYGSIKLYVTKITTSAYKERKRTYIHVSNPLLAGDIIRIFKDKEKKYYVKQRLKKKDKKQSFIVEIARIDGFSMVGLDLERLAKGVTLYRDGYFHERNKKTNRWHA